MPDAVNHDRLFKELLTAFFLEFLELFLPELAVDIDPESIVFLDKEVFTDITSGEVHEADIIVRCRCREIERFFIIHVEDQAKAQSTFSKRMFQYFARIFEKYGLDVYPIALFTYNRPLRREPDRFQVFFPNLTVLDFRFRAIQLNRLDWRQFVRRNNPIAAALLAKMNIAVRDRPFVKLECVRLLATLRLNPAKARLISGFVHTYLKLTATEQQVFTRELALLPPEESIQLIELTNEWIEQGRQQGREEGAALEAQSLVLRLGRKRLGEATEEVDRRVRAITDRDQLEVLCERIYEVETWHDLLSE